MKNTTIHLLTLLTSLTAFCYSEQTPWTEKTVQGFSFYQDKLDYTEGFGAYLDLHLRPNTKNFDNGGGSHNFNTTFLEEVYSVTNVVYDPFQRSDEHNSIVLSQVSAHEFDTTTSNSILNVIDNQSTRFKHIWLSCEALKAHGVAYFRIFEGNGSFQDQHLSYGYLSNRLAQSYQHEVEKIFEKGNVVTDIKRRLIIAYKNSGCKEV
ncbi:MAG: hypothetical protein H0X51_04185 [Parachlamydiaceae bacterium]|nr:hypothetical protein [Parachlamydiaceae bacterium]